MEPERSLICTEHSRQLTPCEVSWNRPKRSLFIYLRL